MDKLLQVCDQHAIKLVLHVQLCPAECGTALLCLIEEEQMVFVSWQHQPSLPPTLKWICGASQDKKKWVNGERRPRQRNREGGQESGGWRGGQQCGCFSVRSSGSSSQKLQMCECERGFRFWLKACLGERGFRLFCALAYLQC